MGEWIKKEKYLILICTLMIIVMSSVVSQKNNFHEDELYSFALSNNETGWFHYEEGKVYEPASEILTEQFAAQPDRLFDYKTVWHNQAEDVHPPLYYFFLHTICSLTPMRVSIWQPLLINLFFSVLTLIMLRKVWRLLGNENPLIENLILVAYALLPGTINNSSFFRMYVMATFMVISISYVYLLIIKSITAGDIISIKLWGMLWLVGTLSALTHYYCIIYLVLIAGTTFVYMLTQKRIKDVRNLIFVSGLSGITAIIIFKTIIRHMLLSNRGVQVRDNLQNTSVLTYWNQMKSFFKFFSKDMCGGLFGVIVLTGIGILIYTIVSHGYKNSTLNPMYFILTVPSIIYFLILCKITIYVDPRYLYPIYGVLYILAVSLVIKITEIVAPQFDKKRCGTIITIFGVILLLSYYNVEWKYLNLEDPLQEKMQEYTDRDVLVIDGEQTWMCSCLYKEIENAQSVRFVRNTHLDQLQGLDLQNMILFLPEDAEADIKNVLVEIDMQDSLIYEKLGAWGYYEAYLLNQK